MFSSVHDEDDARFALIYPAFDEKPAARAPSKMSSSLAATAGVAAPPPLKSAWAILQESDDALPPPSSAAPPPVADADDDELASCSQEEQQEVVPIVSTVNETLADKYQKVVTDKCGLRVFVHDEHDMGTKMSTPKSVGLQWTAMRRVSGAAQEEQHNGQYRVHSCFAPHAMNRKHLEHVGMPANYDDWKRRIEQHQEEKEEGTAVSDIIIGDATHESTVGGDEMAGSAQQQSPPKGVRALRKELLAESLVLVWPHAMPHKTFKERNECAEVKYNGLAYHVRTDKYLLFRRTVSGSNSSKHHVWLPQQKALIEHICKHVMDPETPDARAHIVEHNNVHVWRTMLPYAYAQSTPMRRISMECTLPFVPSILMPMVRRLLAKRAVAATEPAPVAEPAATVQTTAPKRPIEQETAAEPDHQTTEAVVNGLNNGSVATESVPPPRKRARTRNMPRHLDAIKATSLHESGDVQAIGGKYARASLTMHVPVYETLDDASEDPVTPSTVLGMARLWNKTTHAKNRADVPFVRHRTLGAMMTDVSSARAFRTVCEALAYLDGTNTLLVPMPLVGVD